MSNDKFEWFKVAQELAAERDQLKSELAGLRTGFDAQNEVIAGLKKDADRYRWLKSREIEVPTTGPDLANWEDDMGWSIRGNEADTAIDAAMGKGGEA